MKNEPDPPAVDKGSLNDHLANERTFLAWTRTGLGIFALGCVIARLGGTNSANISLTSTNVNKKPIISGFILAVFGIITLLYSIWRYYRVNRQIQQKKPCMSAWEIREPVTAAFLLFLLLIVVLILCFIL
jgi:putative membrane protein